MKASMARFAESASIIVRKATSCPSCEARQELIDQIKSTYQAQINLLEDTLNLERRDRRLFQDTLLGRLGVQEKISDDAADPSGQVKIRGHISHSRSLNDLAKIREAKPGDKTEDYWRKRNEELDRRETERNTGPAVKRMQPKPDINA